MRSGLVSAGQLELPMPENRYGDEHVATQFHACEFIHNMQTRIEFLHAIEHQK